MRLKGRGSETKAQIKTKLRRTWRNLGAQSKHKTSTFPVEKLCSGWGLVGTSPCPGLQRVPTGVAHPEGARLGHNLRGGNKLSRKECAASCSHARALWSGLFLTLGRIQVQVSCVTHQPGRAHGTSTADPDAGTFELLCCRSQGAQLSQPLTGSRGSLFKPTAIPLTEGHLMQRFLCEPSAMEAPQKSI